MLFKKKKLPIRIIDCMQSVYVMSCKHKKFGFLIRYILHFKLKKIMVVGEEEVIFWCFSVFFISQNLSSFLFSQIIEINQT